MVQCLKFLNLLNFTTKTNPYEAHFFGLNNIKLETLNLKHKK